MEAPPAERAAADLRQVIGAVKRGSLRVFGDWFGGRKDNIHVPHAVIAQGEDLVVLFDDGEELRVTRPAHWTFDEHTFQVQGADRVVWHWHYYGRPKLPENRFTIEHWVDAEGKVQARSDVDWYSPEFAPSRKSPAVELL